MATVGSPSLGTLTLQETPLHHERRLIMIATLWKRGSRAQWLHGSDAVPQIARGQAWRHPAPRDPERDLVCHAALVLLDAEPAVV